MHILIIHQNFPGQFRHMASAWSGLPDWEVVGLGHETAPGMPHCAGSNTDCASAFIPSLEICNAGVSPTVWQKERHPEVYRDKIAVIHEGIDTELLGPDPEAAFTTPSGTILRAGDPVITYVARNLEPYRGFHSFMRALEVIQRRHKRCQALIVGGDEVSYGKRPADAPNWQEKVLREVNRPCPYPLSRQGALRHLSHGVAGLGSPCLPYLPLRSFLVDAGSHGERLPRNRFADCTCGGSAAGWRERTFG